MRWFLLPVLATLLIGCSSSETEGDAADPSPSPPAGTTSTPETSSAPTPTPEETGAGDLESAVKGYSDAFLTGDAATAYGLLSQRCQDSMPLSEFATLVESAGDLYGTPLEFTNYEETIEGETATVTYTYEVSAIDQTEEPWVNEDGWQNDDC